MGGLSLLLFWLPVFGPLIAGLVGGWKAGAVGRAVAAVFLPALLTGLMAFAGVGGVLVCLLNIVPLLGGAVLGGLAARFSRP